MLIGLAALAGAICGAFSGINAIDQQMLRQIEHVNGLDLLAEAKRLELMIAQRRNH